MIEAVYKAAESWNSVKESTIVNCFKKVWSTEACKEKLVDFDALDEVPCPSQMERETFLNQVDLEAPFQADLELEADEFESNNNVQNEPNENDPEVHSIAETLPERIYNPITAMRFSAMFTFQLGNTKS
jgi:hypothetical protein